MRSLKVKLLNWCLKEVFHAITFDEMLKEVDNKLVINGVAIPPERVRSLVNEAKAIRSMDLWKLVRDSLVAHAQDELFNKTTNTDQMHFPKAQLYVVDVIDKKLAKLANRRLL